MATDRKHYFVLFDDAINNCARLYEEYKYSLYISPSELNELDQHLQRGWQQGLHLVIFADYEFGFTLQKLPAKPDANLVLHWFARQTQISDVTAWLNKNYLPDEPAGISQTQSDTDRESYLYAVGQVQEAISAGETYQINYTTRLYSQAYGDPIKLYHRLRQPVPYAVLAKLPDKMDQQHWTLSFSPELFLNIAQDGVITTKPMKGTAPILNDDNDDARAMALGLDPKNRAENIMIVDLLRNDLGKIAQTGSIKVTDPLKVSRFGSVWQMTSTVQANPLPDISLADIFSATFPCGSITGAPKRISMQIIDKVETSRRGIYTGSIGWLDKCNTGLGFYGNLNVVIRSLELKSLHGSINTYKGIYGVGSGIVADSVAADEYDECQWKASFLNKLQPEFSIFETMRVQDKQCNLAPLHLARLKASAKAVNILFIESRATTALADYLAGLPDNDIYRVKMILANDGEISFISTGYTPLCEPQLVTIAAQKLSNHDYLRRFKTSYRETYDNGWQSALNQGAFDSLFFNYDNYLLEGGRSTVFIRVDDQWHTPALDLDILNGIMRQQVLSNSERYLNSRHVYESRISYEMLQQAQEIRLCNALHGIFTVHLLA